VVGYQSKKMSSDVRWIGPYAPNFEQEVKYMKRYADPETMDHIIDLRKKLAEAERQRDNALDKVVSMQKKISEMKALLSLA
jgi:hypothetical protein